MNETYPKTRQEFLDWFKSEDDCIQYLYNLRWPDGFRCSSCQNQEAWAEQQNLFECTNCHNKTSITSGTIFHGTRKSLLLWFNVIWFVMAQKTGLSAQNLKDSMGFGSYQTTWTWLHKLRRAMIRPGRDKLKGVIEVDETFIGGKKEGKRGRGALGKTLVVVATECLGEKCGRVRFKCIPSASEEYLLSFINEYVEEGSKVITDDWKGYHNLDGNKFDHEKRAIRGSGKKAHELLPHVHLIDSLIKKWINGIHKGNITPYHLPYYLDEFAFRFNSRLSSHRGKLFYRLIQQALTTSPKPYKDLVKSKIISGGNGKGLLYKLIEDLNKADKNVWALKRVKSIHPIIERSVRELANIEPIEFIKLTGDEIIASNEVEGTRVKSPITKPFHPTAIGIYLIYDFQLKTLEFYELNSAVKGWGGQMVKASLKSLPKDWKATLVYDWSDGFWDNMQKKNNQVEWMQI